MTSPQPARTVPTQYGPARIFTAPGYIRVIWKDGATVNGQQYYSAAAYVSGAHPVTGDATLTTGPDTVRIVPLPAALKDEAIRLRSLHSPPLF